MDDLLYQVLLHGDSAITWVGVALAGLLSKWILGKIESEKVQALVGRALSEVRDSVGEVYQTYVSELKAAAADGKLTEEEKMAAKQMAIDVAKANLGMKGMKRLMKVLGFSLEDELDSWMETKVEAAVAGMKAAPLPLAA